ncbi:ATP-binding protein [Reinekea marinisedimentorum]|uniref:histidine kinase n=1 Tax=Reinekea marinisedimentorum TaxID=230495 RepID=A0A4V2UJJ6_9GAMM|nr:ATP-binding protein [Reinekea marinisedimentorum]TCS40010.1 two-component system sensor histidine kinase PhoQ [Reinekea marinisedimentorum]
MKQQAEYRGSLTRRLLLAVAAVLILFLGITGYALDRAYEQSQLAAQGERLFLRIFNLLSVASMDDHTLSLPRILNEQRFNSPESGLIGLVLNNERQSVWESLSSEWYTDGEWLRGRPSLAPGEKEFGLHGGYVYQRNGFVWEDVRGEDQYFEFWVLESAEPFKSSLQTFRNQLWGSFVAVAVALLLAMLAVTVWGLSPLRQLAVHLHRIRSGETESLSGNYPKELTPLTTSLNQLLQAEKGQRERYRKAMGDLAHSLKTPLAIMRTESAEGSELLNEQIGRMDQIVRYQLQRAVTDARSGPVIGQRCQLNETISRIGNALEKAYMNEDKVLDIEELANPVFVAMDSNDVFEVFGNLVENALKYGRSVVCVGYELSEHSISVHVDDDGNGIGEAEREQVLTRGKRLDTIQPGQGIGLAMVNDILASYQIDLAISSSPFGGARFSVTLPLA